MNSHKQEKDGCVFLTSYWSVSRHLLFRWMLLHWWNELLQGLTAPIKTRLMQEQKHNRWLWNFPPDRTFYKNPFNIYKNSFDFVPPLNEISNRKMFSNQKNVSNIIQTNLLSGFLKKKSIWRFEKLSDLISALKRDMWRSLNGASISLNLWRLEELQSGWPSVLEISARFEHVFIRSIRLKPKKSMNSESLPCHLTL